MLDALGIDLKEIIFVIINFLILVGLLGKFLYKPFLGILEKRKQTIKDAFDNAAAINRRADEKMANYSKRIANVEEEGREIIVEAKKQADIQAQRIIEEAHMKADEIIAKAEKTVELERERAMIEMRNEVASLAMMAAEQIVGRELQTVGQEAIVDEVLENARNTQWQN
ncbi:MAG: F0F1 ATP synthase subunit B [Firmicutes bacterium]|nr:F0F1 ATP synthase subunit B [Bacillota bacterium]